MENNEGDLELPELPQIQERIPAFSENVQKECPSILQPLECSKWGEESELTENDGSKETLSSNPCDLSKFVRSESQQLLNLTNGRRCAICWYKELRQKHANSQPGAYVAQAPETPMDVDVLNPSTSITAEPNANIPSIIQQELAKYMKGKMIMDLLLLLISLIS
ncbi:hypothetical protein GH714_017006 [Hevea brasiliensis]|uniref:Uncharacterized protein n=1 Tax=Hevea brasiliensis TaxID=3981 RepID=A0A6A6M224_HEVBR|nr:hypothetical protein GH714_017006 [Hevea brasiliensis]